MCEEGGRSEKMFEGKCKGGINSFILDFMYTQAKKYPNGKQNFGGFCQIVPKPLRLG